MRTICVLRMICEAKDSDRFHPVDSPAARLCIGIDPNPGRWKAEHATGNLNHQPKPKQN
jgi:hypothetical protein